jgi:hypothetical protein
MWILGSFKMEATFFFLPALFGMAIAMAFPHLGDTSLLYGLLATALIDSGHVYTTFWRTLFHPEERNSSNAYWILPIAIFLFFFTWYFSRLPGLWSFVVYSTLFHHVRQVYGFSKWYQALNKRTDKFSDYFLYALSVGPIFIYHFRPDAIGNYYSTGDLFLFPDFTIFKALMFVYAFVLVGWIMYESRLWRNGTKEVNRLISVGFPALIYAFSFFIGKSVSQILFPLLFLHGIAYCGVMGLSLTKTRGGWFSSMLKSLLIVGTTAVVFGMIESWLEGGYIGENRRMKGFVPSIVVGLYLTPLYCHYLFDAMIWKRSHREAKIIYSAT